MSNIILRQNQPDAVILKDDDPILVMVTGSAGGGSALPADGDKGDVVVADSWDSLTVESATPAGGVFAVTGRQTITTTTGNSLDINQGAQTNVPAIDITNMGVGASGLKFTRNGAIGWLDAFGAGANGFNSPWDFSSVHRGFRFFSNNNGDDPSPQAFEIVNQSTLARHVLGLKHNTALSTGDFVRGLDSASVVKFRITAEGGAVFSADVTVPDEAYDATGWNGNLEVPTKNAVRDEFENRAPKVDPDFTGTVDLDQGNVPNSYGFKVTNVGGSSTGYRFEYVGGGGIEFGRQGSATSLIAAYSANKGLDFQVEGNAFGNGSHAFNFFQSDGGGTRGLVKLKNSEAANTGDFLTAYDSADAIKARIKSDGSAVFSADVTVPDEAYGSGWDGSLEVPTKNAVYDKIEALIIGGGSYTDEQAQDAIGMMIDGSLTYVDATPLLQRSALTGDVTAAAGSNATTIANNAVTDGKFRQSAGLSIVGRSANTTGNVADITAASDGQVLRRSGTAIGFGAIDLASANAVTGRLPNSNLTQGVALSVRGVTGNATADVADIAAGSDGQVLRRSGTALAFGALNLSSANAITGDLPLANLVQSSAASRLLGRGSASGAGDFQEITIGPGLVMSGTSLQATPSIQAVASAATVTPTFSNDQVNVTALAVAMQLLNPTGTAVDGWGIAVRIKDNGTGRALSYDTQYRAIGVTLPTTTVANKTLYLGMVYNAADTKWDVVAVAQEA